MMVRQMILDGGAGPYRQSNRKNCHVESDNDYHRCEPSNYGFDLPGRGPCWFAWCMKVARLVINTTLYTVSDAGNIHVYLIGIV
jgi:hypothetical protein